MGGSHTINGTRKYQVSLRRQTYSKISSTYGTENFCGGAILNKRWILTAAQCTRKSVIPDISDLYIAMGDIHFDVSNSIYYLFRAEEIVEHPSYATSGQYLKYDISLIRTNRDIDIDPANNIQPIPLAREWIEPARPVDISGWGLMEVSVKI